MTLTRKLSAAAFVAGAMVAGTASAQAVVVNQAITESEVIAAQGAWCQALVDINAT